MNAMKNIEVACRVFRDHHDRLSTEIQALDDEYQAMVRRRIGVIRQQVQNLAQAESRLAAQVEAAADQFDKPRTQVFHGVIVGMQKGMTTIEWDSDEATVSLIRDFMPAKAPTLIVRPASYPSKSALKNLPDDQLERIGVRRLPGKDRVVVKPVKSEIDKMVASQLKALKKHLTEAPAQEDSTT